MNKLLVLLAGVLLVSSAMAQEIPRDGARLSWEAPTARENEVPLPPDEIQGYEVFWSSSPQITTGDFNSQLVGNVTQYMITDLAPATWYFAVRTLSTDGLISVLSTIVSKTIQPPPVEPKPPTNIEIQ